MVLSSLHTSLRAFDFGSGGPLACFSHVFTNMFDRRCADMFGHVCLFGSGGPLACLVMFKQTCWELWSLLHMAHWHVYILFDRLTCTMTCQVKQMIGIVSWAKVPWQKLQTKVVSTSCFEMSWWGSLEAKQLSKRRSGMMILTFRLLCSELKPSKSLNCIVKLLRNMGW